MMEHTHSPLGIQKMMIMMLGMVFAIAAIMMLSTSNAFAANHNLMPRVNEALRDAGVNVTPHTQMKFAKGVASGHYTSYTQLVGAIKWHKQQGHKLGHTAQRKHSGMKVRGAFHKKAVGGAFRKMKTKTAYVKGEVAALHENKIELINVEVNGQLKNLKFDINDWTKIDNQEIRRGSMVKVIYNVYNRHARKIINLAPEGEEDFYGPVDCPTCANENN